LGECGLRQDLIMVGSVRPRTFTPEERAFVQAVADVLDRAAAAHRAMEFWRHKAWHDPLTGLPNRARLESELLTMIKEEATVAVLVCDLDGLKEVNDRLGHRRGDELLIASAARIRAASRQEDVVARTGGDEFVVVCPNVSLAEARVVAERIRIAVAAPLPLGLNVVRTTVSVGVALSEAHSTADELVERADAAMYQSKERRRRGAPHVAAEVPVGTATGASAGVPLVASRADQAS
jgi:diguanylate cyclase (GGDEF)-like protein